MNHVGASVARIHSRFIPRSYIRIRVRHGCTLTLKSLLLFLVI